MEKPTFATFANPTDEREHWEQRIRVIQKRIDTLCQRIMGAETVKEIIPLSELITESAKVILIHRERITALHGK